MYAKASSTFLRSPGLVDVKSRIDRRSQPSWPLFPECPKPVRNSANRRQVNWISASPCWQQLTALCPDSVPAMEVKIRVALAEATCVRSASVTFAVSMNRAASSVFLERIIDGEHYVLRAHGIERAAER